MSDFFQYLIAPHDPALFVAEYFDAKPLHIKRASPDYFEDVLSLDEVIEFLNKDGNVYPNIQVVRDGQEVTSSRYTYDEVIRGYHFNQVIDPKKLGEVVAQEKSSIRIFHAQRNIKKVGLLCQELEAVFRCPVQANIYLSPPESRGFGVHFDTHSVLALQLQGAKHWKVFDSPFPLPLNGEQEAPESFMKRVANAKCIFEGDVTKGDFLYIPRGFLHEVSSGPLPSVHITFGLRQHSAYDLFDRLVSDKNNLSMRKSLPLSIYQEGQFEACKKDILRFVEESLDQQWEEMSSSAKSAEAADSVDQIRKVFESL